MFGFLIILVCVVSIVRSDQLQFRVIKEWKYVNYTWLNEEQLRNATATGMYNPEQCIMSGLAYYNGTYYITTPRMYNGAPATLSWISEGGSTAPKLNPFPSWSKNRLGECDSLQNVQNVEIAAEGMLYVIDSGRTNTLGHQSVNYCPAKLVKYDLKITDGENKAKEVYTYTFPETVVSGKINYLYDLVLDEHYVYISDNSAQDPGLIVFSEIEMISWKIRHGTFKADSNAKTLNVSGTVLETELNLAGLALGPELPDGRLLYYSPLSSFTLFAVNTEELKKPHTRSLQKVRQIGQKSSQSDGMIMDDKGVLYFGQLGSSGIVKWDSSKPYRVKLIAQDPNYVQWPNSFTFNDAGDLVVLSNTLAKFITHRVDLNEPNFRLLAGNVGAHSYVINRFQYKGIQGHVHFHSVAPNVNDLLIPDDIEPKNELSTASRIISGNGLMVSLAVQIGLTCLHGRLL